MAKHSMMFGALTVAVAALSSNVAYAQDAAPQGADGVSEEAGDVIIVTAQKREESLQDVPIAVSAFSSQAIEDKVIDDGVDLSFSVPNLTVDQSGASLRGVGNLAISSTSESGLGYHVNGVYIGTPATEAEYFDLQRIEVLRGPQGTLYGRNTTAGVINLITQKPTDQFEGYVTAGYGNFNSIKGRAAINIPFGDAGGVRLAGYYLNRDGYTKNLFTGRKVDDRDQFGLRGSLRLNLGDDTRADLVVSYFREDDRRAPLAKGVCTKDVTAGCSALSAGFETPDSRTTIFNTIGRAIGLIPAGDYFAGSVNPADLRVINQDVDPTYFVREWNASFELSHDFGDISLTSLTGYQKITRDVFNDFDRFVPTLTLTRPVTFDLFANGDRVTTNLIQSGRRDLSHAEMWSQELRLASNFSGPVNFLLGGNYYRQDFDIFVSITHPALAALSQLRGNQAAFETFSIESNPSKTRSYGVFGEVYFDLSDSTRLTGGIRYSHDKKFILTRQIFLDPLPGGAIRPYTEGRFKKGVVTGRLVLDHKFGPDLTGYVSASRGYKAGGINPGGPAGGETFKPEFLNAVEIGLKGQTSDRTFTASAAAFYYDYKDLQIGQVGVTSAITVNSDAEVYGAELEWAVRPIRAFQVDGSLSYLHTKVKDFRSTDEGDPTAIAPNSVKCTGTTALGCTPGGPGPYFTSGGNVLKVLDGNELPFSPNWKLGIGAQYEIELGGDLQLTPRVDHYLQGRFFGTAFNKRSEDFPGYQQTDLKLLLAPADRRWELRGYVKNLFNNDDITRITQEGPLVGRFRSLFILEPRTYGVEATYRF